MNIKIKGTDIELTEAIKNYTNKKTLEALEKFKKDSKNIFAEIELSKTNNHHTNGEMYKASAKIKGFSKGIFIEVVKDDLYASIDTLKYKLVETIAQYKYKKESVSYKIARKFKNIFKRGE